MTSLHKMQAFSNKQSKADTDIISNEKGDIICKNKEIYTYGPSVLLKFFHHTQLVMMMMMMN